MSTVSRSTTTMLVVAFIVLLVVGSTSLAQEPTWGKSLNYQHWQKSSDNNQWVTQTTIETSSEVVAPNLTPLISSSATTLTTEFSLNHDKVRYTLTNTAFSPLKADSRDWFGMTQLSAEYTFNQTALATSVQTFFSAQKKFAVVDAQISKQVKLAVQSELRPFSKISYIAPLETGRSNVSAGLTWSNGFTWSQRVWRTELEMTNQVVLDTGAIFPGKRIIGNCEFAWLYPIGRMKIGPQFGLVSVWSGYTPEIFRHRNQLNYGLKLKFQ